MRCSQSTRLEAQPGEQSVRLHNRLQRWGHGMRLVRLVRLLPVLEQDLLAFLADRRRDLRLQPPTEVRAELAPARLDVRRDRVAHARREEARRRLRHDRRVHEHDVRVLVEERVAVELARRPVQHRERRARRVRRRRGRQDRYLQREPVRDRLRGVDRLPAAERDDEVGGLVAPEAREAVDLLARGLAAEDRAVHLELGFLERAHQLLARCGRGLHRGGS